MKKVVIINPGQLGEEFQDYKEIKRRLRSADIHTILVNNPREVVKYIRSEACDLSLIMLMNPVGGVLNDWVLLRLLTRDNGIPTAVATGYVNHFIHWSENIIEIPQDQDKVPVHISIKVCKILEHA